MKRAALGIRMHSGWGVVVAVAEQTDAVKILDRRRIAITDPDIPEANQPYHHAANLKLAEAEKYLAKNLAASERLALTALQDVVLQLNEAGYRIPGSAVLVGSGRPLPPLSKILASHALIHAAEGEFFRDAARNACEQLKISVTGIVERELDERANAAFGDAARLMKDRISGLGKSIGPPWTKDHKAAALAASILFTG
jgi:hypothetical protein